MSNQGWEGLGGPIELNRTDFGDIDPTLEACCRREVETNRQRSALEGTLRRHDVVAQAERRRRHLIPNLSWGTGCRCCYDPNSDGGEYRALIEERAKLTLGKKEELEGEEDVQQNDEEQQQDGESEDDEFDYLLDEELPGGEDDGVLAEIEQRRRAELELVALHQEAALQHGYGAHRQMHPARVLKAAGLGGKGASPAVVLHLVDPDSTASASLDLYLEKLAETNRGTKFLRSGGRSTLLMDADFAQQVLPRLSVDNDMPTLVAIRDGVVVATRPRLQGFVRDGKIEPSAVKDWLDHAGVLITRPPVMEELCRIRPEELALYDYLPAASNENKPPEGERFDCGMPECHKRFPHEHVGVKTEQQEGLMVQEQDVVAANTAEDVE